MIIISIMGGIGLIDEKGKNVLKGNKIMVNEVYRTFS